MKNKLDLLKAIMVVLLVFVGVTFLTAYGTYYFAKANLSTTKLDEFQIQEFSSENCEAVFKSLSKGGKDLADLMCGDPDVRELLKYADWAKGDYDDKRSFGGGSFMMRANANGRYEYADVWWIPIEGERYMIYIQSASSRFGRENDGVSLIAVTTWDHYSAIDGEWDYESDDETVIIGQSLTTKEE